MAILETDRLVLRQMEQADFPALCEMLCDPTVMHYYEGAFAVEEAREWLNRQVARYQQWGFGLWAVTLGKKGRMIGQCGLTMQRIPQAEVLEVGYLFNHAFWHQGYATEAARACRDYAFQNLDAKEVYSIIRDVNYASQAVAQRNGMRPRCTFIKHYRGVDMPHIAFSIRREEWEERGE